MPKLEARVFVWCGSGILGESSEPEGARDDWSITSIRIRVTHRVVCTPWLELFQIWTIQDPPFSKYIVVFWNSRFNLKDEKSGFSTAMMTSPDMLFLDVKLLVIFYCSCKWTWKCLHISANSNCRRGNTLQSQNFRLCVNLRSQGNRNCFRILAQEFGCFDLDKLRSKCRMCSKPWGVTSISFQDTCPSTVAGQACFWVQNKPFQPQLKQEAKVMWSSKATFGFKVEWDFVFQIWMRERETVQMCHENFEHSTDRATTEMVSRLSAVIDGVPAREVLLVWDGTVPDLNWISLKQDSFNFIGGGLESKRTARFLSTDSIKLEFCFTLSTKSCFPVYVFGLPQLTNERKLKPCWL